MNNNVEKITFDLNDEQITRVQRVYSDLLAHKAVLSEVVSTNPGLDITTTTTYLQLKDLMVRYDKITSELIKAKTCADLSMISGWRIDFDKKKLIITR